MQLPMDISELINSYTDVRIHRVIATKVKYDNPTFLSASGSGGRKPEDDIQNSFGVVEGKQGLFVVAWDGSGNHDNIGAVAYLDGKLVASGHLGEGVMGNRDGYGLWYSDHRLSYQSDTYYSSNGWHVEGEVFDFEVLGSIVVKDSALSKGDAVGRAA